MVARNNFSLFHIATLLLHVLLFSSSFFSLQVAAQLHGPSLSNPLTETSQSTTNTNSLSATTTSSSTGSSVTSSTSSFVTTSATSKDFTPSFPHKTRTTESTSTTQESTTASTTSTTVETTPTETSTSKISSKIPLTTQKLAATSSSSKVPPSSTTPPPINQSPLPTPTIQNPESVTSSTDVSQSSANNGSPKGFLQNTTAVVSTFTILGIVVIAGIIFGLTYCIRRRRRQFEDLEDQDYLGGSPDKGLRRGHETFASSFVIGEKEQLEDLPEEDENETALGHPPMEHNPFSDPYQHNYNLPNTSIIPDEYRLSLLEQAQRNPQQRVSNHAGQMQYHNYGSASNTVPLSSTPAHYNYNYPSTSSSAPFSSQQQRLPAAGGPYDQAAPVHYLQEPHVLYQSQPSQLHLQRQPSTKGRTEWGVAC